MHGGRASLSFHAQQPPDACGVRAAGRIPNAH